MNAPRHILASSIAAAAIVAMAGCSAPGNDCSSYTDINPDGWRYNDTLTFMPVHTDSICRADLILSLRHSADYPYSNVWLEVTVGNDSTATPRTPVRRDTISIDLCDKYGRWYGKGIGMSFQLSDTVATGITHANGMPVYVRHIMRTDSLTGIEQAGIELID